MADYDAGQGLKGAAGGALAGASFGGPIGAVIGGGLGLLGGFGNGENEEEAKHRQMLMDYYGSIRGRNAPQAGPAAQAGYSGFRTNQADFIGRMDAMSRGQGPSLAAQQFRQSTDRNMAQQAGMANSGRGGPMASINAANNMGLLGAQASQGAASARIAEQNMALGHLGGMIQAGRGADEQMGQWNAGQRNQNSWNNLDARLRGMQMNDQTRLQLLQQLQGNNQAQANKVGWGDQIMAGGAGMYSMGATQAAQGRIK